MTDLTKQTLSLHVWHLNLHS